MHTWRTGILTVRLFLFWDCLPEVGGLGSNIAIVGADVSAYSDIDLTGITTYTYWVYAYNAVIHSTHSNVDYAIAPPHSVFLPTALYGR
jgi:hypothetical protein